MHPLETLEFSTTVAKRAQYEAFEFRILPDGVLVRNGSHETPADHEYLVSVEDGVPCRCTCPADIHFEEACKHRVAVAIRDPILDAVAVRARPDVRADGGTGAADESAQGDDSEHHAMARLASDSCSECLEPFPCWECHHARVQSDG